MLDLKLSFVGKITLTSVIIYCLLLSTLEAFVVYFHTAFVSKFELTPYVFGISVSDYIYHSIFILSLLFQVFLCLNALTGKNSIQLVALVVFNILSLAYAGVQIYQHIILENESINTSYHPDPELPTPTDAQNFFVERMRPIEGVIAGLVLAFSVYLGVLSYILMKEFGWENYRTYSADLLVRRAFLSLSVNQTLLKLDAFFILSYAIQLVPSQLLKYNDSVAETVLLFVFGFILISMAWFSIVKEMKYLLLIVINLYSYSLIYVVYRLYEVNVRKGDPHSPYQFTWRLLTFTLCVMLVLICITVYYGTICFRNMVRGIYVYSAYGLPGRERDKEQDELDDKLYLSGVPGERTSKRVSQMVKVAHERNSSKISLD